MEKARIVKNFPWESCMTNSLNKKKVISVFEIIFVTVHYTLMTEFCIAFKQMWHLHIIYAVFKVNYRHAILRFNKCNILNHDLVTYKVREVESSALSDWTSYSVVDD